MKINSMQLRVVTLTDIIGRLVELGASGDAEQEYIVEKLGEGSSVHAHELMKAEDFVNVCYPDPAYLPHVAIRRELLAMGDDVFVDLAN